MADCGCRQCIARERDERNMRLAAYLVRARRQRIEHPDPMDAPEPPPKGRCQRCPGKPAHPAHRWRLTWP